ncbi:heme A synthase [Pseudoxanthomonas broegbernensis]|uniref:Heme A synthase n=1 Tax=Pseudoxanthomonas broegbernensis TaxID=83619 RepID=A0A7V8GKL0_9GAMM|nr:COX15/CtaA family protein [Pseudoxanthomonas broegbernensis]KAF1685197.1 heme A synthase [Pseudoxanthomonas broegbernensis]MBB6065335.1 cytochrome c oxidase assembly protein subunit 15 [Pseudoxanthomonas broegbernensis]
MNALARPALVRHFHRIAWLAVILTACVVVFGAFVRLSDAGLSCPDWPTCYGRATWPSASQDAAGHAASQIRPFDTHKAWREQVHRHLAASLGVLVLLLALLAARRRRLGALQIVGASLLVAAAIPAYMYGHIGPAFALAGAGEAVLLLAALRWSNVDLARAAVLTLAVIVFQALLGKWTVTLLLKPVIVMGHLLGGLATFSLLAWMAWRATDLPIHLAYARALRRWVALGIAVLGVQIALGGWTSANYAALACGGGGWITAEHHYLDFPRCVGQWWPPADFREGFVLWRGIGVDYEGGVLDGASRIAIQMAHRLMAIVAVAYLLWLAVRLHRTPGMRGWAFALGLLVALQAGLGVLNVKLALPLSVAVLHNAGATALLFVLVTLLARLKEPESVA